MVDALTQQAPCLAGYILTVVGSIVRRGSSELYLYDIS